MKNVTFYLLIDNIKQDELSAVELLMCELAAECWRNDKSILIACEDKRQALRLDRALWVRPSNSFIPHSLASEESLCSSPIKLTWSQQFNKYQYDLLINLQKHFTVFATKFTEIIDFVPHEKSLKQLARERYKAYRIAGFNLNTVIWK